MSSQARTATGKPRRSQSERREETRGRLLDATVESLIEVGYAGTTIRRVTELAGVSQGAQSHHFPHRIDLVTSAFERLAEQRVERYRERARELPPTARPGCGRCSTCSGRTSPARSSTSP